MKYLLMIFIIKDRTCSHPPPALDGFLVIDSDRFAEQQLLLMRRQEGQFVNYKSVERLTAGPTPNLLRC
jgi:hypothetical protein